MNFADYQAAALTFVLPRSLDYCYLRSQVRGEAGEVCGVLAKHVRGDPMNLQDMFVKECGDWTWGVAVLYDMAGLQMADYLFVTAVVPEFDADVRVLEPLTAEIAANANEVARIHAYSGHIDHKVVRQTLVLMQQLTGCDIGHIMDVNIAKLTERMATGTIQGRGETVAERKGA